MNEECLVNACKKHALTASLSLVHTARRSYRSDSLVSCSERAGLFLRAKSCEPKNLEEGEVVTRLP